jgi:hypothetical protein
MLTSLLKSDGRFDRAAIMRRAHARRKWWLARRIKKTWSECLRDAWAVARQERADTAVIAKARAAYHTPPRWPERSYAELAAARISRAAAAQMEART